ncbi:DUF3388 domain-containing protein [Risungbinella massiliensis]|uniref:DUF3388 domain-containing protein n=1 Tax=Risungbinella massiliensis TaxID=1329796 RepID=UPI0005CBFF85|nr:DUF3388 domain-containing protein [Risungbinella massiliensis]
MENNDWYLEYQIHRNKPGLLGDLASLLGMLSINIITINGVDNRRRGMLIRTDDQGKIEALRNILIRSEYITLTALRPPKLMDRMAVRHGRYLDRCSEDMRTYRFTRDEIGLLVDFLAEIFQRDGHQLIGIRGMPRVGKTESIVASSVCANKRWTFVSSTLLKQTVRRQLGMDEISSNHVYIIDGIVSTMRANEEHGVLLRDILRMKATKVIEHPDIFVRETEYTMDDFHYIIELRNDPEEEIRYDAIDTDIRQGF